MSRGFIRLSHDIRRRLGAWRSRLDSALLSRTQRPLLIAKLGRCVWSADLIEQKRDGSLTVQGWVFTGVPPRASTVTFNGRPCEVLLTRVRRADLKPIFPFLRDAGRLGFHAYSSTVAPGEPLRIDIVDPQSGEPLEPGQSVFVRPNRPERWPLPDGERMARVHGAPDERTFRLVGFSNVAKLDRVLRDTLNRPLYTFPRILDWGCGCGRLLRYLADVPDVRLTGADVDADNLAWCRAHLPVAEYVDLPLHPPSPLPAEGFDLIVGISVFTHLTEPVQFEWLEELRRVTAKDGIVAVTIHGPISQAMSGNPRLCRMVDERGFLDAGSFVMHGTISDPAYYRNTYHNPEYIRREWSRYFEIVDIKPGCINNVHDLVVMRRRS